MTDCPRCQSSEVVKSGRDMMARKVPAQRYHCKGCGYTWREKISQKKAQGVE
jgi:transposase-like protein